MPLLGAPKGLEDEHLSQVSMFKEMPPYLLNQHLTRLVKENRSQALRMRGERILHEMIVRDAETHLPPIHGETPPQCDRWLSLEGKSGEAKKRRAILQRVFHRFGHRWTTEEQACFFVCVKKVTSVDIAGSVSNDTLVRYMAHDLDTTDKKKHEYAAQVDCWVKGYVLLAIYGATKLANSKVGQDFMQRYG
jgi:hypothetical protein